MGWLDSAPRLFQTFAEPLRALTTNEVKFEWTEVQDKAFQTLKEQLTEVSILVHFNMTTNTRVIADASPVGLGAVLVQGGEWAEQHCVLCRSLSDVEWRYSQTEKRKL